MSDGFDTYWNMFDYKEILNEDESYRDFIFTRKCPVCSNSLKARKVITLPSVHSPSPTPLAIQYSCSCKNRIIAYRKSIDAIDNELPFRLFVIYKKDDFNTMNKLNIKK